MKTMKIRLVLKGTSSAGSKTFKASKSLETRVGTPNLGKSLTLKARHVAVMQLKRSPPK